jgi:hypothetical protein
VELIRSVSTSIHTPISIFIMTDTRRITANLPGDLLDDAREVTGEGIRETLIERTPAGKAAAVLRALFAFAREAAARHQP